MSIRSLFILSLTLILWGCSAPPQSVYHTVERGQTLYRISRVYGVDERYLARINGINDPTQLKVGDQIFIPGAEKPLEVPATVPPEGSPPRPSVAAIPAESGLKNPPKPSGAPISPAPAVRPPKPPPPAPAAKNLQAAPSTGKGLFVWPTKGKVVKNFGSRNGQSSKGIEIAVPAGSPVVAAAAGRVTYSGDGIRGYGNLIILKHDDSFFTVYGFNDRNLVEKGTFVSKGQKIAFSGAPPGKNEGRLHFEIRFGKDAVDPIFYLP